MIKGFLALFTTIGWISPASGTHVIISTIGDCLFYFMPVFLGYTSARKFNSNIFIGMALGACMVYPAVVALRNVFESPIKITFMNIPVILPAMGYASTVIPIILAVLFSSKVERFFNRILPDVVKTFLLPLFTLLIVVPATFLIIGPVASWAAAGLGYITQFLDGLSSVLLGVFVGGFWQIFVIFGLHWGLVSVAFNNLAVLHSDPILGVIFAASFAQIGAVLAIMVKTKNRQLKALSVPAFISGIFGVTEPAIYGITLPRKRPFIISCIVAAMGGGISGFFGSKIFMLGGLGIFQLPSFISPRDGITASFYGAVTAMIFAFIMGFILTYIFGYDAEQDGGELSASVTDTGPTLVDQDVIYSPFKGELLALSQTPDQAFASGDMGMGVTVIPFEGRVVSPVDGEIVSFFPTGHALAVLSGDGAEILIHVGLDTVNLNGKYFAPKVKQGDKVKKGQLLLEFDMQQIQKEGYNLASPVIVTNTDDYKSVTPVDKKDINYGDLLLKLER
ncbi:hypothetical protein AAG570_014068 [Ranatra chinensis]|uniref:Uncharacterized protein n=1 Tax=Ranatra chinensis TaxID=642074 RepID=A0ABD0YAX2_9HEMI